MSKRGVKIIVLLLILFQAGFLIFEAQSFFTVKEIHIGEIGNSDQSDREPLYESIIFAGDIMLARHVEVKINELGVDYPFAGLDLETLAEKPAIVGNFEAAVPTVHIPTENYTFRFSVAISSLMGLNHAGFTHLSLANNHAHDYGLEGINNTAHSLKILGIESFGHLGLPNFIKTPHGSVGLLGINAVNREVNIEDVTKAITVMSESSTYQYVYIHWGQEYRRHQDLNQKKLAEALVKAGADLVIGHHPHVVQGVEVIDGVPIVYSLGNYVFDQYFSADVMEGMLAIVNYSKSRPQLVLKGITSASSFSQPQLMKPQDQEIFLAEVAKYSDPEVQSEVMSGVISI